MVTHASNTCLTIYTVCNACTCMRLFFLNRLSSPFVTPALSLNSTALYFIADHCNAGNFAFINSF